MRARFASVTVLLLLLASSLVGASDPRENADEAAEPPHWWAAVCLYNALSEPVRYRSRWGNEAWKSNTVHPGKAREHAWAYPKAEADRGQYYSPDFSVDFDSDHGDGEAWKTVSLQKNVAPNPHCDSAKLYDFHWVGSDERFFSLDPRQ